MMVTTKTTISFRIPDEYALSVKFKAQHPDWIESCSSEYIGFTTQETCAVDMQKEGTQE